MKIVNLNNHPIRVERSDGSTYEYPPSGKVLRLQTEDEIVNEIDKNPIVRRVYYFPEGSDIPPVEKDTYYIVPSQVAQIMNRPDFISPDTKQAHGAKRMPNGQVISVTRFRVCDTIRERRG